MRIALLLERNSDRTFPACKIDAAQPKPDRIYLLPLEEKSLVDVALIALLLLHRLQVLGRMLERAVRALRDHIEQRRLHILGHARRIATDIEERTALQPLVQFRGLLLHAVLHID